MTEKPEGARARDSSTATAGSGPSRVRVRSAQAVWLVCVICATVLALGALCVALEANQDNPLIAVVLDLADRVDLGIFSPSGGVKEFTGENAEVKNALVNWGLGAIFWLVAGRTLERLITR